MFQFTHPGKGATRHTTPANLRQQFQFTHPGKGATQLRSHCFEHVYVSIHAPWEGCDIIGAACSALNRSFQFTHPGKGATIEVQQDRAESIVSIHAPWEGCDSSFRSISFPANVFQFTHPGKGATASRPRLRTLMLRFNSRTLGRVRPQAGNAAINAYMQFQFTHPGKGATRSGAFLYPDQGSFNSRTLGRVRPRSCVSPLEGRQVSIHAPWEGCDLSTKFLHDYLWFQFTHPGKGATSLT